MIEDPTRRIKERSEKRTYISSSVSDGIAPPRVITTILHLKGVFVKEKREKGKNKNLTKGRKKDIIRVLKHERKYSLW